MTEKTKILLVDDDNDLNETNRSALEAAGFAVVVATSKDEGLSAALANECALAVIDVMMQTPEEGFELARALRQNDKTKKMHLLMLSAVNAAAVNRQFLFGLSDEDIDDTWLPVEKFVDKPVAPAKLVELVQSMLG